MSNELQVVAPATSTVNDLLFDINDNVWNGSAYVAQSTLSDAGYAAGVVGLDNRKTSDDTATTEFVGDIPGGALANCVTAKSYFGTPTPSSLPFAIQQVGPVAATLTTLPAIPANWINAAGINAGALNGKGDWATPTELAAVQTHGDSAWATATGFALASIWTSTVANRIDADVSSRMAAYTQPTGFLAATFPTGTVASTANITGGTITTTTNLTNAPTAGDFTATMKASLNAATPTVNNVTLAASQPNYAPATTAQIVAVNRQLGYVFSPQFGGTGTIGDVSLITQYWSPATITNGYPAWKGQLGLFLYFSGTQWIVSATLGTSGVNYFSYTSTTDELPAPYATPFDANGTASGSPTISWFPIGVTDSLGFPVATSNQITGIPSAVWQDTTAGDFTVAGSIGKSLGGSFTALGTSVFTTAALVNAPSGGGLTPADIWNYSPRTLTGTNNVTVVVSNPVADNRNLKLVQGDAYNNLTRQAIVFFDNGTWPVMTDGSGVQLVTAQAKMSIAPSNNLSGIVLSSIGVITGISPNQIATFSPTKADTTPLVPGTEYVNDMRVSVDYPANTDIRELITGQTQVNPPITTTF